MGMPLNARMTRYSLTALTAQPISIGSGSGKVIIQAGISDIKIAYDEGNIAANSYFTITAGSQLILDQPVPKQTSLVYCESTTDSVLEVWIT